MIVSNNLNFENICQKLLKLSSRKVVSCNSPTSSNENVLLIASLLAPSIYIFKYNIIYKIYINIYINIACLIHET